MRHHRLGLALLGGLFVFAAPPLAAAAPLAAYARLSAFADATLSPSGERVAYIAPEGSSRKLLVRDASGAKIFSVDVGTAKVAGVEWAGEDILVVKATTTALIHREVRDISEVLSVAAFNIPKHSGLVVFGKYPGVIRTVFGDYGIAKIGQRWFGFYGAYFIDATGNVSSPYKRLMRVDLETGETSPVAVAGRHTVNWLVGPDGTLVAHTEYDHLTGDWRVGEGGFDGGRTLASGNDPIGAAGLEGLGRTPGSVVISVPTDGRTELREAGGETPGDLTAPSGPIPDTGTISLIHDRVTHLLVGYSENGDSPHVHFFDPALSETASKAFKSLKNNRVFLVSASGDFKRMLVETRGGSDSGTDWLLSADGSAPTRLGSAHPDIGPDAVGLRRHFNYTAADGFKLHGVVTLPVTQKPGPRPVVVLPHGGPYAFDDIAFDWWAEAFASLGYVVFQPNFRGSAGYGLAYRNAGFGEWGRKMQTDISDGLAALAREGLVDSKRACIVGGSYGGYAAVAGVTLQKGLYRCAAAYGGVLDLPGFLEFAHGEVHVEGAGIRWWRTFMGVKSDHDPRLKEIDPASHADAADAPILLLHGAHDSVVPIRQSQDMEARLKAAGRPVELVTLDGADHWLTSERSRQRMLELMAAFVVRHNPPD